MYEYGTILIEDEGIYNNIPHNNCVEGIKRYAQMCFNGEHVLQDQKMASHYYKIASRYRRC